MEVNFLTSVDGINLDCVAWINPAEQGEKELKTGLLLSPNLKASAEVLFVYHAGEDITSLLSEQAISEIKQDALGENK